MGLHPKRVFRHQDRQATSHRRRRRTARPTCLCKRHWLRTRAKNMLPPYTARRPSLALARAPRDGEKYRVVPDKARITTVRPSSAATSRTKACLLARHLSLRSQIGRRHDGQPDKQGRGDSSRYLLTRTQRGAQTSLSRKHLLVQTALHTSRTSANFVLEGYCFWHMPTLSLLTQSAT